MNMWNFRIAGATQDFKHILIKFDTQVWLKNHATEQ